MNKKKLISLYIILIVVIFSFKEKNGTSIYYNNDADDFIPYASFDDKYVYIVKNVDNIDKIDCNDHNIVVLDDLCRDDPDMKVIDSCRIRNRKDIDAILDVISNYCNDTSFNRSKSSMKNEWVIHNLLSSLSYKKESTDDVDLNNGDEKVYESKILTKILGN